MEGAPLQAFHSSPGEVFPLFHPLADVVEWRDAPVLACDSSDSLVAVGLATRSASALHVLVANLTSDARDVHLVGIEGSVMLRRLDEETAHDAAANPAAFRTRWEALEVDGELRMTLAPFAVVRFDAARPVLRA
jgi:hypothetical protein